MKKLLIAAALTASVCSFGQDAVAPINAQTFDGESYVIADDAYITKADGDASAVTAYGGEDTLAASDKTTEAGAAGANYLNLSTEGSTLWRKINTDGSDYGVADDGTYIDTLVQFTATEEDPTTIDTDAKLAMWLLKSGEDDAPTYTLKVKGFKISGVDKNKVATGAPANFALNATVNPGTWYRLTVKAVKLYSLIQYGEDDEGNPTEEVVSSVDKIAFAIYLDGNLVVPVLEEGDSIISSEWTTAWASYIDAAVKAKINDNALIPTLNIADGSSDTLYGVGFKGTGAIDSIAWTDKDIYEFSAPSAAFTLTIAMDENSIDSVTYTFGEGDAAVSATVKADTADIEVPANAVVKFTAVAKDWFTAPTIADITMTANTTTDEIKGVAVTASDITFTDTTIPEGKGSDVVAWAKAAGKTPAEVAAAATLFNNYLLNVTDFTVDPQIKIVSIDVTKSPVEVVAEVTDANGSTFKKILDADDIKGALKYKAAATLEALKKATPKAAIGAEDKFIQVVVE